MGMYVPIVVMSGVACYLYTKRVLIPAIRGRYFRLEHHAVALAAIMALAAHFTENLYYGVARISDKWLYSMIGVLPVVGAMKLLVLVSAILATSVYNKAVFGEANLRRLLLIVLYMWLVGSVVTIFVKVH